MKNCIKISIIALVLGVSLASNPSSYADARDMASTAVCDARVETHSKKQNQPYYLTGKEVLWAEFPKTPALASPVDLTDLTIVLSIQASRNAEQIAEAKRDAPYSIKLLTDVIDPAFESNFPKTYEVLKRAGADGAFITSMLKKQNSRLRPFVQHPTLVIPVITCEDFSYPSGHSSGAELQARLLGKLFPAKAEDLLHRARQVADSRVVAGVHYASDTCMGLFLGDILFKELDASPKFRADLEEATKTDKISLH
jgi:acid phosphatase (class A)